VVHDKSLRWFIGTGLAIGTGALLLGKFGNGFAPDIKTCGLSRSSLKNFTRSWNST
jgi:hypothetical protein